MIFSLPQWQKTFRNIYNNFLIEVLEETQKLQGVKLLKPLVIFYISIKIKT